MGKIEKFEDIKSWQKAKELTAEIYKVTTCGEFKTDTGLKNQIQRAAVSIMSNIAEGFARDGNKEFTQFLSQAKGSCGEVQAQLYVAREVDYIDEKEFKKLYNLTGEINTLIGGFLKYLKSSSRKGLKYE